MKIEVLEKYQSEDIFEQKELAVMKEFLRNNEDALTRENEIAHFTVSAWIINKTFDKVLMAYHNIYDSWSWLGGHVDGDADFLAVALKEANEESGIDNLQLIGDDCISVEILPVKAHLKKGKVVNSHLHFNITYAFIGAEDKVLLSKEDENSAVRWLKLSELTDKVSEEHMLPIYYKIIEKIKVVLKEG